jgi:hypothetical protein
MEARSADAAEEFLNKSRPARRRPCGDEMRKATAGIHTASVAPLCIIKKGCLRPLPVYLSSSYSTVRLEAEAANSFL